MLDEHFCLFLRQYFELCARQALFVLEKEISRPRLKNSSSIGSVCLRPLPISTQKLGNLKQCDLIFEFWKGDRVKKLLKKVRSWKSDRVLLHLAIDMLTTSPTPHATQQFSRE